MVRQLAGVLDHLALQRAGGHLQLLHTERRHVARHDGTVRLLASHLQEEALAGLFGGCQLDEVAQRHRYLSLMPRLVALHDNAVGLRGVVQLLLRSAAQAAERHEERLCLGAVLLFGKAKLRFNRLLAGGVGDVQLLTCGRDVLDELELDGLLALVAEHLAEVEHFLRQHKELAVLALVLDASKLLDDQRVLKRGRLDGQLVGHRVVLGVLAPHDQLRNKPQRVHLGHVLERELFVTRGNFRVALVEVSHEILRPRLGQLLAEVAHSRRLLVVHPLRAAVLEPHLNLMCRLGRKDAGVGVLGCEVGRCVDQAPGGDRCQEPVCACANLRV
mmetsp:Transcript_357/g.1247  ORF Transcript_357/g.1247 Transcript_357/m.1247 type:complete len:330 (-) Transcript_357:254-1243(-)